MQARHEQPIQEPVDANTGGAQAHSLNGRRPFRTAERAPHRDAAVVHHHRMHSRYAANRADRMIWDRAPLQIVDEPAQSGNVVHPTEKGGDPFFAQMMREQAAHDKVDGLPRHEGEHVGNLETDAGAQRRARAGNIDCSGIEIDADQVEM